MRKLFPANTFVPPKRGTGDRLVIAEAPGQEEQIMGEPLVGGSGKLFDGLCSKAGVSRDSLTLINTIQCRPPDNVYPLASEARQYISKADADTAVAQCYRQHVKPVLTGHAWKRIDILGDRSLAAVTGKSGIYNWRGLITEAIDLPGQEIVVPTIHPAALMRDQSMLPVVVSDLKKSLVQPPEHYNVYPSLQDVKNFQATTFCFDIENNQFTGEVYMVGLSDRSFNAICVPFKGPYIAELRRIFQAAKAVIGHNIIQHDLPHLGRAGVVLNPESLIYDTILMHHLVQPDLPHDLEFVASIFINKKAWKHQMQQNKELYCCRDTDATMQIYPQLRALLKQFDLLDLYMNLSVPVCKITQQMKRLGVKIDISRIAEVRAKLQQSCKELEGHLPAGLKTQTIAVNRRIPAPPGTLGKSGKPVKFVLTPSSEDVVPWRSDKAVGEYLYGQLKLPVQHHVKTGKVTTDKGALERLSRLAAASESKKAILAIRELRAIDETLTTFAKEKMTFGTSIHANFNVHGTNSGRLSSSEPNMQNIPEDTRCIYVPHHADWSIIQVDFASIENRITAHLAGDTERLERFSQPGFSEHKWAVEKFYGVPMGEVIKSSDPDSYYSKAKHIVHGSNYGLGARKMSLMYDIPEKEVKQKILEWKQAIPKTSAWQEQTSERAHKDGVLTNPFGRKRWFYTSAWFTESLSFIPQSSAADVILRCMIGLMYERIEWPVEKALAICPVLHALPKPANLLVQVHDSLVFEAPNAMVDELVVILRMVMEQPWPQMGNFSCPIAVDYGPSWGELQHYEG